MHSQRSAIVVGSGPNGLAAAITLARAGLDVTIHEASSTSGGGTRSAELTLPGFTHDVCSAIHPLGIASPFFRSLPLHDFDLEWIHSPAALAHPLDNAPAITLERSVEATGRQLGRDEPGYHQLLDSLVSECDMLLDGLLAPLVPPRHPFALARFGLSAIRPAAALARSRFASEPARALFGGLAAHSVLSLDAIGSASFGLVLGMLAHGHGWPLPRGGARSLGNALVGCFQSFGGTIVLNHRVTSAAELDDADLVLFDTDPRQFVRIAGARLSPRYRRRLEAYRFGPAAFKVDWALSGPIPWRDPACATAATVHLGGTLDEIAASEHAATHGEHAERPFVLLTQPSLFDSTRAPAGRHTAWAYCHLPNGSTFDMTARIEDQVERFAPGFKDTVLARNVMGPAALERYNPNAVGGDIVGGSNNIMQMLARPVLRFDPYATPIRGWFLCSASTPPGGGVHGMCGYHAARAALRSLGVPP